MRQLIILLILIVTIGCQQTVSKETYENIPDTTIKDTTTVQVTVETDTTITIDTSNINWTILPKNLFPFEEIVPHPQGQFVYFFDRGKYDNSSSSLVKYDIIENKKVKTLDILSLFPSELGNRIMSLYRKGKITYNEDISVTDTYFMGENQFRLFYNKRGIGILIEGGRYTGIFDFVMLDWNLKVLHKRMTLQGPPSTQDLFVAWALPNFHILNNGNILIGANAEGTAIMTSSKIIRHDTIKSNISYLSIDNQTNKSYLVFFNIDSNNFCINEKQIISIANKPLLPYIHNKHLFHLDSSKPWIIDYINFNKTFPKAYKLQIQGSNPITQLAFFPLKNKLFVWGQMKEFENSFVGFITL